MVLVVLVEQSSRCGARFKGHVERMKVILAVKATGINYSPLIALERKRVPYKKVDERILTLNDCLIPDALICIRDGVASVDSFTFE